MYSETLCSPSYHQTTLLALWGWRERRGAAWNVFCGVDFEVRPRANPKIGQRVSHAGGPEAGQSRELGTLIRGNVTAEEGQMRQIGRKIWG